VAVLQEVAVVEAVEAVVVAEAEAASAPVA
jgi:hypothetical protein